MFEMPEGFVVGAEIDIDWRVIPSSVHGSVTLLPGLPDAWSSSRRRGLTPDEQRDPLEVQRLMTCHSGKAAQRGAMR